MRRLDTVIIPLNKLIRTINKTKVILVLRIFLGTLDPERDLIIIQLAMLPILRPAPLLRINQNILQPALLNLPLVIELKIGKINKHLVEQPNKINILQRLDRIQVGVARLLQQEAAHFNDIRVEILDAGDVALGVGFAVLFGERVVLFFVGVLQLDILFEKPLEHDFHNAAEGLSLELERRLVFARVFAHRLVQLGGPESPGKA